MAASICVFIQARMSSSRFPGKVLAPFRGKPLIHQVLTAVERALGKRVRVVVATSNESSDAPLAYYVETLGVGVFRGSLDNVFERFRKCVCEYPCDWVLRLSGDSPLLDAFVLQAVISHADRIDYDLVTTIFPRTFPSGHNAELIRVSTFMTIDAGELSSEEREHVTAVYYHNPSRYRIKNLESGNPKLAQLSWAVDTVDDLRRLERVSDADIRSFSYSSYRNLLARAG